MLILSRLRWDMRVIGSIHFPRFSSRKSRFFTYYKVKKFQHLRFFWSHSRLSFKMNYIAQLPFTYLFVVFVMAQFNSLPSAEQKKLVLLGFTQVTNIWFYLWKKRKNSCTAKIASHVHHHWENIFYCDCHKVYAIMWKIWDIVA